MPTFPTLACRSSLRILCSYAHLFNFAIEFELKIAIC